MCRKERDVLRLIIKKIAPQDEKKIKDLCDALSPEARERLERKRNERLRMSSACALSLFTPEQRGKLKYRDSGKPYLDNGECEISVSHSDSYAVLALCDRHVGVDIEDTVRVREISDRAFFEGEMREIERGATKTELWTRKEALFKYLSDGSESTKYTPISLDSSDRERYGVNIITLEVDGATVSVCCAEEQEIEIVTLDT